ncbi:RNA-guided endonuclease InsQ/TnpB family protein [Streptomyces jeddahensis]|uniref:Putative transposase n=1 Tax=Streptomyces jeddahensis TaxID=1716141 RepID=A0A177HUG7_9ACTN|nr:RNA-guided endonuclease TnpB family protein [Streptomyces jeddahensis]OAH14259.1 putative transposase [Streptomyces jeddahensis]
MATTHVKRAFKYRFYPTDAQAAELSRTFGCVRKVYNMALDARTRAWQQGVRVNYNATSAMLTAWKKTEELAPQGARPSTVTVSRDAAGRWFVSMLCEDLNIKPLAATGTAVGIDVGLDHLLTSSTGEKVTNPRHERKDRARLVKAQRELSRKAKGNGANRVKPRQKVARIHARVADRRRDALHKITTRLVRENQTLVIVDLAVRNMVKNRKLARAISDAAWSDFRSMLEYKAAWCGRDLVVVDRFFPSSKLCHACGTLAERLPLNVRTWTCGCGTTHDRDVNAAKNLLAAGLAVSVCRAGVRPQRRTPGGQSVKKQKTPRREP